MGIRIQRHLGWALTDVEVDERDNIIDSRFNLDNGWFGLDWEDKEEATFERYLPHLKASSYDSSGNMTDLIADYASMKDIVAGDRDHRTPTCFFDIIHHWTEGGDPKVIVFQPLWKDWSRRDDIMDYIEANGNTKPTYKEIDHQLYPYQGWMDKRNGKTEGDVDGKRIEFWQIIKAINFGFDDFDDSKLQQLGFQNLDDAKQNLLPAVPSIIVNYCRWLRIFKDDSPLWQLRPILYTYWS